MGTPKQRLLFSREDVERLPDLARLEFALEHLPDAGIVSAHEGMRGRGRNGHPVRAMWCMQAAHRHRLEPPNKGCPPRESIPDVSRDGLFIGNYPF